MVPPLGFLSRIVMGNGRTPNSLSEEDFLTGAGLEVDQEIIVPLDQLHYQFRREFKGNPYLMSPEKLFTRPITDGPLARLLEDYKEYGLDRVMKSINQTDYFKFFKFNEKAQQYTNWGTGKIEKIRYPKRAIREKVVNFCRLYENIKSAGYLVDPFQNRTITVLQIPYEVERFGYRLDWEPYEIWNGHHRAACLHALGYSEAKVVVLKFDLTINNSRRLGQEIIT
jgi:hypothetical protein